MWLGDSRWQWSSWATLSPLTLWGNITQLFPTPHRSQWGPAAPVAAPHTSGALRYGCAQFSSILPNCTQGNAL